MGVFEYLVKWKWIDDEQNGQGNFDTSVKRVKVYEEDHFQKLYERGVHMDRINMPHAQEVTAFLEAHKRNMKGMLASMFAHKEMSHFNETWCAYSQTCAIEQHVSMMNKLEDAIKLQNVRDIHALLHDVIGMMKRQSEFNVSELPHFMDLSRNTLNSMRIIETKITSMV